MLMEIRKSRLFIHTRKCSGFVIQECVCNYVGSVRFKCHCWRILWF